MRFSRLAPKKNSRATALEREKKKHTHTTYGAKNGFGAKFLARADIRYTPRTTLFSSIARRARKVRQYFSTHIGEGGPPVRETSAKKTHPGRVPRMHAQMSELHKYDAAACDRLQRHIAKAAVALQAGVRESDDNLMKVCAEQLVAYITELQAAIDLKELRISIRKTQADYNIMGTSKGVTASSLKNSPLAHALEELRAIHYSYMTAVETIGFVWPYHQKYVARDGAGPVVWEMGEPECRWTKDFAPAFYGYGPNTTTQAFNWNARESKGLPQLDVDALKHYARVFNGGTAVFSHYRWFCANERDTLPDKYEKRMVVNVRCVPAVPEAFHAAVQSMRARPGALLEKDFVEFLDEHVTIYGQLCVRGVPSPVVLDESSGPTVRFRLNTWSGFTTVILWQEWQKVYRNPPEQPLLGYECVHMLHHIFYNMCNRNVHLFCYAIQWCAFTLCKPTVAPGMVLFVTGKPGSGKSVLLEFMSHGLGRDAHTVSNIGDIKKGFDIDLKGRRLVVFSDLLQLSRRDPDYPAFVAMLKNLCEVHEHSFRQKGLGSERSDVALCMAITSNAPNPLPLSVDDGMSRRDAYLDCQEPIRAFYGNAYSNRLWHAAWHPRAMAEFLGLSVLWVDEVLVSLVDIPHTPKRLWSRIMSSLGENAGNPIVSALLHPLHESGNQAAWDEVQCSAAHLVRDQRHALAHVRKPVSPGGDLLTDVMWFAKKVVPSADNKGTTARRRDFARDLIVKCFDADRVVDYFGKRGTPLASVDNGVTGAEWTRWLEYWSQGVTAGDRLIIIPNGVEHVRNLVASALMPEHEPDMVFPPSTPNDRAPVLTARGQELARSRLVALLLDIVTEWDGKRFWDEWYRGDNAVDWPAVDDEEMVPAAAAAVVQRGVTVTNAVAAPQSPVREELTQHMVAASTGKRHADEDPEEAPPLRRPRVLRFAEDEDSQSQSV